MLGLLLAAAVAAVVCVLALTDSPTPSPERQAHDLAGQLRCPTCDGESVAQSDAPMARSMRSEITAQLAAGRSPSQIRDWFRDRYGDDVVLDPARRGVGWVLWVVPPLALAGGLGALLVARRARRTSPATAARPLGVRSLTATAVVVAAVGVAVPLLTAGEDPTEPTAPVSAGQDPVSVAQELDDAGRYDEAVAAWRRASRAHPDSAAVRTRWAFDLLRTDHAAQVPRLVRPIARGKGDGRGFALLVLGLAQRDLHQPSADRTLRAFLRVAPDHPAADQVRRLLAG